jgi:hypothetical protein
MATSNAAPPEMKNISKPLRASSDSSLLLVCFVSMTICVFAFQRYELFNELANKSSFLFNSADKKNEYVGYLAKQEQITIFASRKKD